MIYEPNKLSDAKTKTRSHSTAPILSLNKPICSKCGQRKPVKGAQRIRTKYGVVKYICVDCRN